MSHKIDFYLYGILSNTDLKGEVSPLLNTLQLTCFRLAKQVDVANILLIQTSYGRLLKA